MAPLGLKAQGSSDSSGSALALSHSDNLGLKLWGSGAGLLESARAARNLETAWFGCLLFGVQGESPQQRV